jgi:hypothetical protein
MTKREHPRKVVPVSIEAHRVVKKHVKSLRAKGELMTVTHFVSRAIIEAVDAARRVA